MSLRVNFTDFDNVIKMTTLQIFGNVKYCMF